MAGLIGGAAIGVAVGRAFGVGIGIVVWLTIGLGFGIPMCLLLRDEEEVDSEPPA